MNSVQNTYTYLFPRAALAVDCVVFGFDGAGLKLLLIQRDIEPFAGKWALPGGFVRVDETLEAAALRELREETGLERVYLEQLYTFGAVDRDPRERVVSVAYTALVKPSDHEIRASTDARRAAWFRLPELPALPFDHPAIVETALRRLQGKVRYAPIGFELLPRKFTLSQLQGLYETILETRLDKRNFRKKILSLKLLEDCREVQSRVRHRAARLYRFDERRYRKLLKRGFSYAI